MACWWLGAALAAPTARQPTFAPRPTPTPAPNVFDAEWLIASSGICSDFKVVGSRIEYNFHPEASVTFTDAPFNKAVNLEEGVEIGGVDYSEVDILVSGSWTGKNLALLTPTSSCDDPPKGHQDEFDVTVFKVEQNQACGEACVHYSGEVSTTSDNFVASKDGRFLCQVFIEWGAAAVGTRRQLRRRLSPLPLPAPGPAPAPAGRRTLFAPQPEKPVIPDPDVKMKKWLIAAAGMCSSLSVTPLAERAGPYSIADISFEFHPDTSIAFMKAPHHGGVQLDDGVEIRGEEVGVIDVLASSVWELKNVALLRPVSSCDDPPEGQQDQYRVSVFKVNGNEPCADEPGKCVRYQGKVEARSSDFENIDPDETITMEGHFPCQLYVDTYGGEGGADKFFGDCTADVYGCEPTVLRATPTSYSPDATIQWEKVEPALLPAGLGTCETDPVRLISECVDVDRSCPDLFTTKDSHSGVGTYYSTSDKQCQNLECVDKTASIFFCPNGTVMQPPCGETFTETPGAAANARYAIPHPARPPALPARPPSYPSDRPLPSPFAH